MMKWKKKRIEQEKKTPNVFEETLKIFNKLNESLEILSNTSRSLKTSASILTKSAKSDLSEVSKNLNSTAKIMDSIDVSRIKLPGGVSIVDAEELTLSGN